MDISEIIVRNIKKYTRDRVNTAIPAVVVNINNLTTTQTVDVLPLIDRVYEDGVVVPCPVVYEVPVVFPSAGGGILSFPIVVGDTVLLTFSMRSMEEWLEGTGEAKTPTDARHFDITDAIAIPGLYPKKNSLAPSSTDVELKFKNMSVKLQPDNTLSLASNSSSITLKPNGDIDIVASGNVNISGTSINLN